MTQQYPTYPHLENLDRVPYVLEAKEVWVTEKIHGFNARFGHTIDGEFWVGSRNNVVTDGLQGFVDWAKTRDPYGVSGYTFFGEWAGKGIQKGIDYGDRKFYLFAVMERGALVHPSEVLDWAERLECLAAPLIYGGPTPSLDRLEAMRSAPSEIATGDKEGVVVVPWPPVHDPYGRLVIAKWKNPGFEERAKQPRPDRPPLDIASVQAFVDQYATRNRLDHVLAYVAEEAQLFNGLDSDATPSWMTRVATDLTYIGSILRAYYEDVVREGHDDHESLSDEDKKMVGKVLNVAVKRLLAEWRDESLTTSVGASQA